MARGKTSRRSKAKTILRLPIWSSRRMQLFTRSPQPVPKNHTVMPSMSSLSARRSTSRKRLNSRSLPMCRMLTSG